MGKASAVMSRNYDNWERLVAAVIKREQIWQLCHANSRSCSTTSFYSSDFSSQIDEDSNSTIDYPGGVDDASHEFVTEWIKMYAPGIYIIHVDLRDGARYIRQARFSRKKFTKQGAKAQWLEIKEKVYELYHLQENSTNQEVLVDTSDVVSESIHICAPGIRVTLLDFSDGIRYIGWPQYSNKHFMRKEAAEWWAKNKVQVYEKYNQHLVKIDNETQVQED